jgi:hypothetical protein
MQTGSETAGGKSNPSGGGVDPQKEAAYWCEQHPKQPYAKNYSYEQFEHAYKTGYNSFLKKIPARHSTKLKTTSRSRTRRRNRAQHCHGILCVRQ